MKNKIGIINYGVAGNIYSVSKAVEMSGGKVVIVKSPDDFSCIDKLIMPGVGGFKEAMEHLRQSEFIDKLREFDKPMLGICLGMQILSKIGFEPCETKGLGLLDAEVKPIECNAAIPHMGFNKIQVVASNEILKGVEQEEFYFMHSYEVINYTNIASLTNLSGHEFVSSIKKDNIYGVQFHPEKSRKAGIKLLTNFVEL